MRISKLCLLCCAVALGCPVLLHAQFQDPTPDELKMTEDPKAPGAVAVYLYREDVTDDSNHFHSMYERIKILTEKGKNHATIRVPYIHGFDTVTDIQGRTIHADGTVVPLNVKPADLMDYKGKNFQVNTIVFELPAAEVGSILEYRLKVRGPDVEFHQPTWDVQTDLFCHKVHFSYHPYVEPGHYIPGPSGEPLTRLMYAGRVGPSNKVEYTLGKNTYTLDMTDVPAVPVEDWMPPLNTLKMRVEFYYTGAFTASQFWDEAGKSWAKSASEFINPTNPIKAAAAGLVAPSDSDEQKARKLYAAVQKLDNTAYSRTKSEAERKKEKIKDIHKAEDVWREQSGTDDQIALLYLSLARAAGLKAWPAQVTDRNRAVFDNNYLSTRQLNDYIAIVEINGKEVFLDPGQKMCPFGQLAWKHTLAGGFRLSASGAAPLLTPASTYKSAVLQRVADLNLDPAGNVTGTVRFIMSGPEALRWRQLTLESDQDEVKKRFNESIHDDFPDGVQADFDHFLALDDYDSNLLAIVKVSGTLGSATGKHYFLPGLFFEARAKHPFAAQEKRTVPVDVHYPKTIQDDVVYHLPSGFSLEGAPEVADAAWPDHAVFKITSKKTPDTVEMIRTLLYNFTFLDAKDYPNLHDFYQKVAAADQQQLVLTRAAEVAGK